MVKMQTNYDCGPVASYNAIKKFKPDLNLSYAHFKRRWKWKDTNSYKDNLRDQPGHHIEILRKLNIPYRRTTAEEIIKIKCPIGQTVILLHDPDDPILTQHWCRYIGRDEGRAVIFVDWGNGKTRAFSFSKLIEMFKAGAPDFAYVVGEHEKSRWNKFQNWFWLKLGGITKRITSWF